MLSAFLAQVWLPVLGLWLDVGEPPQTARFALVLGGDSETRPFKAAELINEGFVDQVLLPRQRPSPEVSDGIVPSAEEIESAVLRARGVGEDRIAIMEGDHLSTFDEARSLRRLLEENPGDAAIVVTNAYHTRRARWTFRTVLGAHAKRVRFVSAPNSFRTSTWWRTPDGTKCVVSEYVKLVAYWLRYGHGLLILGSGVGLGIAAVCGWRRRYARINEDGRGVREG